MHILLFILYSAAACYALLRLPFCRNSTLRPGVLLLLFALHVLTGCLHNVIAYRYFPQHGDVWRYFNQSFVLRHQMLTDFHVFITDWTWSSFVHESPILLHMLLDCLSFDNMYINTLLFAFPVFLGNIALFRVFRRHFAGSMLTALSVFLLPSVLFWTSCIHREGALYMFLGFFLHRLDRLSPTSYPRSVSPAAFVPPMASADRRRAFRSAILFFLLIAFVRYAVALTLLPALAAWWWPSLTSRPLRKKWLPVAGIGLLIILAFAGPLFLQALATEQQSFQLLRGHSRIELPVLDGTFGSLLHTLPAALLNGWLQPLPGTGGQTIYLLFTIELLLVWAIVLLALLRRAPLTSFSTGCILFALLGMLLTGLVVPFVGAIVRYRSIYLPFLLAPFLHYLCTRTILRRIDQWAALRL